MAPVSKFIVRPTHTETKRERFVRLAERRTTKALHAMRLVGNLASRNNYEYTEADARKIVGALAQELDNLRKRFSDSPGRDAPKFRL